MYCADSHALTAIFICVNKDICGRTGRSVGATRNSTESGRSRVQSQVAAGAKYGELLSREKSHGFSPEKIDQNSTMPTMERPSIGL